MGHDKISDGKHKESFFICKAVRSGVKGQVPGKGLCDRAKGEKEADSRILQQCQNGTLGKRANNTIS